MSSVGCIAFFHFKEYGSPRHVIHYEQPQQVRMLRYQHDGQQLLAALRGRSLSLWDPTSPLHPLLGLTKCSGWYANSIYYSLLLNVFVGLQIQRGHDAIQISSLRRLTAANWPYGTTALQTALFASFLSEVLYQI